MAKLKIDILLDTHGMMLKKKNGSFWLSSKATNRYISPLRINSIIITAECNLSTAAIKLAINHGVPIYISQYTGKVVGKIYSKAYVAHEHIRNKQFLFCHCMAGLEWIVAILKRKAESQYHYLCDHLDNRESRIYRKSIENYEEALTHIIDDYVGYIDIQSILTTEASMGRIYWKYFRQCLPAGWSMKARGIRPAQDIVNCALNYLYGFLYTKVEQAIYTAGLNPYQAILHQNQYNDPVLVFDLIEELRPYVDELILHAFINKEIDMSHVVLKGPNTYLNKAGKKLLTQVFYDMNHANTHSLSQLIHIAVRRLRTHLDSQDMDTLWNLSYKFR